MDEYQARSWQTWYHHMALVMMAMLPLLRERHLQRDALPLLSSADVKILLARLLPRRDVDPDELVHQLHLRHQQRQAAIEAAYRRQRLALTPDRNLTTALSSGATPASQTEGERSETEVKAAGVVACSEVFGVRSRPPSEPAYTQKARGC